MVGNQFRRGYRFPRNSVPAWIPIFQGIGSDVDTESQRNRFQRGYRIPKESVPAWIPNPKRISSSVNAEFQRILVPAWIPNPKVKFRKKSFETFLNNVFLTKKTFFFIYFCGKSVPVWIPFPRNSAPTRTPIFQECSSVDTESQRIRLQRGRRYSRKSAPTWTPIFQVQLSVLDFLGFGYILVGFGLGLWIYGFSFRFLGVGYIGFGLQFPLRIFGLVLSPSDFIGWVGFFQTFIRLDEDDGWMMDGGRWMVYIDR
ncbi:uncharacterized protein OCT59_007619 [Rhizophagus irregularis]|uniref:uncharacterized protein n=1 Tax=Rhizophagus irregularis TaxID=588596 RepID=UPI0033234FAB|nr:hypothetical protein OCT59_007619 [Rhizophagus irregularis]